MESGTGRPLLTPFFLSFFQNSPKLSKALNATLDSVLLRKDSYFKDLGVDVKLGVAATDIDAKSKSIKLDSGASVSYDYLIVATGADPRTLPIPGADLKEIHVLRGIEDSTGIDASIQAIKAANAEDYRPKMVIVGSSFIGMEMAAVASKFADVTVIGMEKVPFERVLGLKIGAAFQSMGEKAGIKFRMESVTEKYQASEKDPSKVGSVVIKGTGEVLPADIVVLGVGVMCATSFLKNSGIPLERDGSVVVDASMKTSDDNIYAVGDIARYPYHITGQNVRVEHWSVAQNQARVAAHNIAKKLSGGSGDEKFEHIPYFWSVQYGRSMRYCGHAFHFDVSFILDLSCCQSA